MIYLKYASMVLIGFWIGFIVALFVVALDERQTEIPITHYPLSITPLISPRQGLRLN